MLRAMGRTSSSNRVARRRSPKAKQLITVLPQLPSVEEDLDLAHNFGPLRGHLSRGLPSVYCQIPLMTQLTALPKSQGIGIPSQFSRGTDQSLLSIL